MTKDEALELSLEAQSYAAACLLNQLSTKDKHAYAVEKLSASTAAIKEALAQSEQEPVKFAFRENNDSTEVLRVTTEGEFIWHEDADRMIEEGDFSQSPALPHILKVLRKQRHEQEPVAMKFKIYKPTVPDPLRQNINNALLPWVYDQDRSSGFDATMWVTPVATLPPQRTWVELTDEEILKVWKENEKVYPMDRSRLLDRTRACIRKAQEK
jgi:hypothetical protein